MRVVRVIAALVCAFGLCITAKGNQRLLYTPDPQETLPLTKLSSGPSEISLDFRLAGVEIEDATGPDGKRYDKITPVSAHIEKFGETGEEGFPELPLIAQLVAIPDQAAARIEIISSSYETVDNINIYPVQPPAREGQFESNISFIKDEEFYSKDEFYPANLIEVGDPVICRDLRMAQTIVNPIQYNPAKRELRIYTHINYRLVFEGTDSRNTKVRRNNLISESFLPLYRSLVPNADEMLAAYEPVRGGYLIITPDVFVDTMKVLARWKHLKGYSTVITRATDIDPDGSLAQGQVFDYIQGAYNTWEIPPEFVCIVGDMDQQIPDFPYQSSYASDHAYSCVDGTDYLADIMITRMSVPYNLATMGRTMRKALVYDREPYMGDTSFWLRGLSVGGNWDAVTPRLTTLWVRQELLRHGYTRVDTSFGWNGYDPGTTQITNSLNAGVSLVSYRGIAGYSGWALPSYDQGNIYNLTHGWKMGIMASLVCGTGNYGADECFGETWIRAWRGTVPAGGPCFYGVSDGDTHTKWNNPIMIGYYWGIFEEGITNFATAAFRGKMELYETYPNHRNAGGWVEKYFHTYNTLGEPELEVRTAIPRYMTVTYPATLPVGASLLNVHVVGNTGSPLEGAYVNLVKGRTTEEVFVGGRTDANGDIALDFTTTTADTMFVTVTARNYVPHLGQTLVQSQAVAVNISAITIDDDNLGNSSGNGNGEVNSSETIEFAIALMNFGNATTATGVWATLESTDPEINIVTPTFSYPDIAPGGTATIAGKFAAQFSPVIPDGEHFILNLNIVSDQATWSAAVPVDIANMMFALTNVTYPGNGNNLLDPGETSQLVVTVQNLGGLAGTAILGALTTADTGITILDGMGDFGNIAIGASGANTATPFEIRADAAMYRGHNINFDLILTSSNGSVAYRTFSIVVGGANTYDPVGPDDYGYYMYDNTDGGYLPCPVYNWAEISPYEGGAGTRITFPFSTDDDAVVVSMPFAFTYRGASYGHLLVGINGFVALDTARYDMQGHHWSNFDNNQLPEPGAPGGLIAPFWDDLKFDDNAGNYGVFRYHDSINHRFIIEWKACYHPRSPGSHPETFQMIINDPAFYPTPTGDAEIVFQYQTVYNDDNDTWDPDRPGLYCTVGMQNLANTDGLQYTYDRLYHPAAAALAAGRAIKITTATGIAPPPDITLDPASFSKHAEPGQVVTDTLNIANVGQGVLNFAVNITADLPQAGDRRVPAQPLTRIEPTGYRTPPNAKPLDFNQPIYPPVTLSQGGPDSFGYRWVDSDEPGGPVYSWVDISGVGTPLTLTDDSYAGPFDLGFTFPFYGSNYTSLYISSNGFLTFLAGSGQYQNVNVPNLSEPNAMIAMLWDDLNPGVGGTVMYYHDIANGRFIVSYIGVPIYGQESSLTFEAILYPAGRVEVMYNSFVGGDLTSNSIGIENGLGDVGLQVSYDSPYLHNSMALSFIYPSFWLFSDMQGAGLAPGTDTLAIITFDATELDEGTYTGHIDIDSNDPDESSLDIPVTFSVGLGTDCQYTVGDINNNGAANGIDVVYGVNYFKGNSAPPVDCGGICPQASPFYAAGDVNGNCQFNGIDVTFFVNYLKGIQPALLNCPTCPPAGATPPSPAVGPSTKPLLETRNVINTEN